MRRIIILSIILIALLVGTIITLIYFTEASIYYRLDVYTYQKIDDHWYSIFNKSPQLEGTLSSVHLENKGMFDGTFRIIVKVTNASFFRESFQGADIVNEHEAVMSFTLKPQQEIDRIFYFNVTGRIFIISIDLQSDQLFLRSTEANWGHQDTFYYGPIDNTTWIPPLISG
jgi:hypothetical protein